MRAMLLAALLLLAPAAWCADPVLAPGGVLRAVYLAGNPVQASRDPATGQTSGISYDLAAELARRAGVRLDFFPRAGIQPVISAVADGEADIGFLANDPSRRGQVLFSQTYLRNPQSFIVPDGSPIRAIGEFDRAGLRIAAGRTDSIGLYLARQQLTATLVLLDDVATPSLAAQFAAGTLDGFGASRLRLRQLAAAIPGLRVLPGALFGVPQAIIVPAGAGARLAAVDAFLSAVRREGFLQAAIDRADTGAEIEPAP
jgi:polar amino acid transport system substrate-binding protein